MSSAVIACHVDFCIWYCEPKSIVAFYTQVWGLYYQTRTESGPGYSSALGLEPSIFVIDQRWSCCYYALPEISLLDILYTFMCVCRLHWRINVFISEYAGTCESYKEFYCPSVIWAPRNSGEGYGEYVWEVVVCIGLFRKCNQYFWFNEFCAWYCEAVFVCLQGVQLVRRRWPKSRRPHQVQADRQQPQWSRRQRLKVRKHWPRRRQRQQEIRRPLRTQRQQNRRLISQVCVPYRYTVHIFTSNDVLSLAKCECAIDHKKSRRLMFMSGSRIF